ncbi:MAG: dTDP-4-dehydrorhamnose reductase [Planctomycetes bacterium]|nr:dTDP-4-dehydrorhamnose reductase [Planctomycetota bacterium]
MRILLLGKEGQVGWELHRALQPLGRVTALDRPEIDLARPASLPAIVASVDPGIIVNAAAFTAVDEAETDFETARRVNAEAVGVLAGCAAERGAWMVHYSTDYVFDGTGDRPWKETDVASPVNAYGRSKLEGERALGRAGGRHLLLRTSWVYASRGHNFVRTILRLAAERDALRVIADQHGVPTPARFLADFTAMALDRVLAEGSDGALRSGTYHVVPRGETTWHGVAVAAVEAALSLGAVLRTTPDRITPIRTSEYPLPARRPANSRLCVDRVEQAFGIRCPDWREHLPGTVAESLRGPNA